MGSLSQGNIIYKQSQLLKQSPHTKCPLDETCKDDKKGQGGSLSVSVESLPILKLVDECGSKLAKCR